MVFEEPKVEMVKIEMDDVLTTSPGEGSEEICVGAQAPMNNCSTMTTDGFMEG